MGSWSESCGFSGMEIGEGETAYVCLLTAPKYPNGHGAMSLYEAATTLIRGTYNDYGYLGVDDDQAVLDVFNRQSGLSLANGADFSIDDVPEKHDRFWIHGRAFDFLPTIKPEFPYASTHHGGFKQHKVKTIGESTDIRIGEISDAYSDGVTDFAARKKCCEDHPDKAYLLESATRLSKFSMTEIFGYSDARPRYTVAFQEAMYNGIADVSGLLESYRRNWLLHYAAGELRKKIVPSESVGPQHSGEIASRQFARFLLAAQTERRKLWAD